MDLKKLFETQKILRDRISYNESDRFEKLILSLLVELGECANEWRGFKFWSKNQQPNIRDSRRPYMCLEDADFYNPLLEEYVDGLHFVLEIGLEHGFDEMLPLAIEELKCKDITSQFTMLFQTDWDMYEEGRGGYYHEGLELYLSLGEMLGFSWEEIEQAYFDKNKINHQRQDDGY